MILAGAALELHEAAAGRGADRLLGRRLPGRVGEGDRRAEQEDEGQSPVDGGAGGHAAILTHSAPMNRRPRLELHGSTASPEEAAAVIAAIEQFLRDTAPPRGGARRSARGCEPRGWKGSSATPAREAWG